MVVENTRTTTTHNLLKEKSPPIIAFGSSVSRVRSSLSTKNADWRSPPKSLSLSPALLCRRRLSKRVRPVQEERDQRCRVQIPKGKREVVFFAIRDFTHGKEHHHRPTTSTTTRDGSFGGRRRVVVVGGRGGRDHRDGKDHDSKDEEDTTAETDRGSFVFVVRNDFDDESYSATKARTPRETRAVVVSIVVVVVVVVDGWIG